jgi:hypothetical protein
MNTGMTAGTITIIITTHGILISRGVPGIILILRIGIIRGLHGIRLIALLFITKIRLFTTEDTAAITYQRTITALTIPRICLCRMAIIAIYTTIPIRIATAFLTQIKIKQIRTLSEPSIAAARTQAPEAEGLVAVESVHVRQVISNI